MTGMQNAFVELHRAAAAMAGSNNQTFTTFLESVSEKFCAHAKTASMKSCDENISGDDDADAYGADQSGEETVPPSIKPQPSRTRR